MKLRACIYGVLASLILMSIYATMLSLISGFAFLQNEFAKYGYFTVTLALGFGVQVGLYSYLALMLKQRNQHASKGVVATTGTTTTFAMISCCTHYVANILPIIATTGIVSLVGQYQVSLFWISIAMNMAGIVVIAYRFKKALTSRV